MQLRVLSEVLLGNLVDDLVDLEDGNPMSVALVSLRVLPAALLENEDLLGLRGFLDGREDSCPLDGWPPHAGVVLGSY